MTELPSSAVLAEFVSNVTAAMFHIPLRLITTPTTTIPWSEPSKWHIAGISIDGPSHLYLSMAFDEKSGVALGSAMFRRPPADIDAAMIADALKELVNLTAGNLKSVIGSDYSLGLPLLITSQFIQRFDTVAWRPTLLTNGSGEIHLWIAVAELSSATSGEH